MDLGCEAYISVGRHRNDGEQTAAPAIANRRSTAHAEMRAKLATPAGRAVYARRKATVEPVIGQIRTRGYRQVSFRGLFKDRCEWAFVALTHNLLKLFRATGAAAEAVSPG